jgi:hypothetical protein
MEIVRDGKKTTGLVLRGFYRNPRGRSLKNWLMIIDYLIGGLASGLT